MTEEVLVLFYYGIGAVVYLLFCMIAYMCAKWKNERFGTLEGSAFLDMLYYSPDLVAVWGGVAWPCTIFVLLGWWGYCLIVKFIYPLVYSVVDFILTGLYGRKEEGVDNSKHLIDE
jgi:CDP-diglyceride synthetase